MSFDIPPLTRFILHQYRTENMINEATLVAWDDCIFYSQIAYELFELSKFDPKLFDLATDFSERSTMIFESLTKK